MTDRIERVAYGYNNTNANPTQHEANQLVADMQEMVCNKGADTIEEETRFYFGPVTVVVFKLTWYQNKAEDNAKAAAVPTGHPWYDKKVPDDSNDWDRWVNPVIKKIDDDYSW